MEEFHVVSPLIGFATVFAIARSRALRVCCVIVAVSGRERAIANQGHRAFALVNPWFGVLWPYLAFKFFASAFRLCLHQCCLMPLPSQVCVGFVLCGISAQTT